MISTHWWGTAIAVGDKASLSPALDELFDSNVPALGPSQPITVSLRGAMIHEALDKNKTNDLLIMTTVQLGDSPPVPRVHFLKNDVKPGWQGDLFDDTVVTASALPAEWRRLTVRTQVYDLDHVSAALVTQFGNAIAIISWVVSLAAPFFGPFAPILAGTPVVTNLLMRVNWAQIGDLVKAARGVDWKKVADVIERTNWERLAAIVGAVEGHDRILDEQITLEMAEPRTAHSLLQPGYYVAFRDPIDTSQALAMSDRLQVYEEGAGESRPRSYAVLEIKSTFEVDRKRDHDKEIEQLIRTLDGADDHG